jgi:hypothetical protein
MRARWILENPKPELPTVGDARVASFWPGRFFWIHTFQLDSDDPIYKMTRSFELGVPYTELPKEPHRYLTAICRCDRYGIPKNPSSPLYEREYRDVEEARKGHKEIVDWFFRGDLKLLKTMKK